MTYDLDALYLNLGLCYKELLDFRKSQDNLEKVFAACSVGCTKRILIQSNYVMGELKLRENRVNEAKRYLKKSLSLSREDQNLEFEFENLLALSQAAFAEDELIVVRNYLREIAALGGKDQFVKPLQLFYKLSGEYYNKSQNVRMANEFERKYFRLTEIINDAEMHRRLMEIQINFIEKESKEKLENQRILLEAQAKVIENQYVINLLLFGVAALTITLMMIFFKLNNRKAAINKRLDELVKERTFELEKSRNDLLHSYDEQQIVIGRISSNLVAALATVSGLINVGKLEEFKHGQNYLNAVEETLVKLTVSINGLDRNSQGSKFEKA